MSPAVGSRGMLFSERALLWKRLMLCRSALAVLTLLFSHAAWAASTVDRSVPQKRPATLEEIRAQQALGRIAVSSDGRFLLYEWGHPYLDWVPDSSWMDSGIEGRMETFIYVVDLNAEAPSSEYLFYPNAASSYWLGDLAPDNRHVVLYELNHDTRLLRAGAWSFDERRVQWFAPRPDGRKLQEFTLWVSNEEFVFPVKEGSAKFARASITTGQAQPCTDCSITDVEQMRNNLGQARMYARNMAAKIEAKDLPAGAVLSGGAANGAAAVYFKDDARVLALLIKKPGEPIKILFENSRDIASQQ